MTLVRSGWMEWGSGCAQSGSQVNNSDPRLPRWVPLQLLLVPTSWNLGHLRCCFWNSWILCLRSRSCTTWWSLAGNTTHIPLSFSLLFLLFLPGFYGKVIIDGTCLKSGVRQRKSCVMTTFIEPTTISRIVTCRREKTTPVTLFLWYKHRECCTHHSLVSITHLLQPFNH